MTIASGTCITHADREEWLEARKSTIGASEAATVLGLNPWQTPLELYLSKLGLANPVPETPAMTWGTRLEPLIAEEYSRTSGFGFVAEQLFVRSPTNDFMSATLDRVRDDGRVVELKTCGHRGAHEWGEHGSDEVPHRYLVQVIHQLIVTGTDVADLAVLIAGQEFRTYTISLDEDIAAHIIATEEAFWDRVLRRDPPPIDVDRDGPTLARLWPEARGEVDLGPMGQALVEEWEAHGRVIHDLQEAKYRCRTQLLAAMQDAATGRIPDGRVLSRKVITVPEQQVKRTGYTYTDLRIRAGG